MISEICTPRGGIARPAWSKSDERIGVMGQFHCNRRGDHAHHGRVHKGFLPIIMCMAFGSVLVSSSSYVAVASMPSVLSVSRSMPMAAPHVGNRDWPMSICSPVNAVIPTVCPSTRKRTLPLWLWTQCQSAALRAVASCTAKFTCSGSSCIEKSNETSENILALEVRSVNCFGNNRRGSLIFASASSAWDARSVRAAIINASAESLLCCARNSTMSATTRMNHPVRVSASINLVSLRFFGNQYTIPSITTPIATAESAHLSTDDHQVESADSSTIFTVMNRRGSCYNQIDPLPELERQPPGGGSGAASSRASTAPGGSPKSSRMR